MASWIGKLLPRHRWVRWTLGVLVAIGVLWLLLPRLAEPYVRRKLQAMIASRVDAELRMGDLAYLPPFGVRVRDARLVTPLPGGSGEIDVLKIGRLDLRLAKLPFGDGPLVIQRLDVQEPELHLLRTEEGIVGALSFSKPRETPAPPPKSQPDKPKPPGGGKLSEAFELRHLRVWGGKVVVEDRTRPDAVPVVWSNLGADVETTQTSPSAYTFQLKSDHSGVAALGASGSFDLDSLHLTNGQFDLALACDPNQQTSGLPPTVQSVLRANRVAGKVGIRGTADVPLRDRKAATFDVRLEVRDGSARSEKLPVPLDGLALVLHARTVASPATSAPDKVAAPQPAALEFTLERCQTSGGPSHIEVTGQPTLRFDFVKNEWSVDRVAGVVDLGQSADPDQPAGRVAFEGRARGPLKPEVGRTRLQSAEYEATLRPQGVRFRTAKLPLPLHGVGGDAARVDVRTGLVVLKDIAARYGEDQILLRSARVPLPADPKDLKQSLIINEIVARVDFRRPNARYPGGFAKVVEALGPAGAFELGGGSFLRVNRIPRAEDGTLPPKSRNAEWFFGISSDDGSFTFRNNVTLSHITGDATVSPLVVDVSRITCQVLGGTATGSGKILPRKPFLVTDGRVSMRDIDLAEVGRIFRPGKDNERLVGRGFMNLTFGGALTTDEVAGVSAADAFHGRGEFELLEGNLWTLPVLSELDRAARKGKPNGGSDDGLTLGEAAGVFSVADRTVLLENAAVKSPTLGLVGSGLVSFDQSLDLRAIVAPLGDWRDNLRQSNVPVVSDAVGEIAGGVQKLVNAATGAVLYQFHIGGQITKPKVETVPAPALTDPAALLFGRMLDERRKQRLIESVRIKSGEQSQREDENGRPQPAAARQPKAR